MQGESTGPDGQMVSTDGFIFPYLFIILVVIPDETVKGHGH